jgi:transcriptional regulator with XRE-family HTH domain
MARPDTRLPRPSRAMSVQVGGLIRDLRSQRGHSQASLANRIEITQSRLSRMESGKTPPSLKALLALAEGLECSPEPLLPLVPLEAPEDQDLQVIYRKLWLRPPEVRWAIVRVLKLLLEFLGKDVATIGRLSMGAKST